MRDGSYWSIQDEERFIDRIGNHCERKRDHKDMLHRYYAVCLQRKKWNNLKKENVLAYIKFAMRS